MANKIEKLQGYFLWGDSKTYLLGWDKVCMPIANGDLGIRKLTTFNKALLGKWLLCFGVEETRLSRRVVATKFGEELGGGEGSVACGEVFRWETFSKNIQFKVGAGNRVKFWTDSWYGDLPLCLALLV